MALKKITGILVAALAAAPYLQTLGFRFLAWDDDRNVFANSWLLAGRWQRFWGEPYYGLYVLEP